MRQAIPIHVGAATVTLFADSATQAIQWVEQLRMSLLQICYPILDMAEVIRSEVMEKMVKNPIYRQKFKKMVNDASKHLHSAIQTCLWVLEYDEHKSRDFAAFFQDEIQDDVKNIRNAYSKYLQRMNCPSASLIARIETLITLLEFEIKCYDMVCEHMFEISGNHLEEIFGELRAFGVYYEWVQITVELGHHIPNDMICDCNKCKEAHKAINDLYHHAFGGDLIKRAMEKTKEENQ